LFESDLSLLSILFQRIRSRGGHVLLLGVYSYRAMEKSTITTQRPLYRILVDYDLPYLDDLIEKELLIKIPTRRAAGKLDGVSDQFMYMAQLAHEADGADMWPFKVAILFTWALCCASLGKSLFGPEGTREGNRSTLVREKLEEILGNLVRGKRLDGHWYPITKKTTTAEVKDMLHLRTTECAIITFRNFYVSHF
jgi:hypothetical protein